MVTTKMKKIKCTINVGLHYMSSQETAFEIQFLREMEAEILIGQLTYNQICDIYNESFSGSTTEEEVQKKPAITKCLSISTIIIKLKFLKFY